MKKFFHVIIYFNSSKAFCATFSLSKILTTKSAAIVNAKVMPYIKILTFKFPSEKYFPTIVEEITEGNLQKVEIKINLSGFTDNNPPIYTRISFGAPVIAKHIAKTNSIFSGF